MHAASSSGTAFVRVGSRILLTFVTVAALVATTLGVTAGPALADQVPESIDVSGVVVVLPDETGTRSVDSRGAHGHGAEPGTGETGGVWVASSEGPLIQLDEQTIDSDHAKDLRSGARFEGSVELPATVADAVVDAVEDVSAATDAELLESVAEATQDAGVTLAVQEAEIEAPLAAAGTATAHQADVVFLAKSSGQTSPVPSTNQMRSLLSTVSGYWAAQTDGQASSIAADRVASLTASGGVSVCNQMPAWGDAVNQLGTDVNDYMAPGSAKHLVLLVNDPGCGAGLGSVGDPLGGGIVWVNLGGWAIAQSAQTLAHEIGHNFGLGHANARVCSGGAVDAPYGSGGVVASPCDDLEYGDLWSAMGVGVIGYTDTPAPISLNQREFLKVVPAGAMRSVTAVDGSSQTFTLNALGSGTGLRGLKVEPTGADPFMVEYRNGDSVDPPLPIGSIVQFGGAKLRANPGVKIVKSPVPDAYGAASAVLTHQSSGGITDETLRVGDSLAPLGGATVTVTALSQSQATVRVDFVPTTKLVAGTPKISGKAKVGTTLTADPGVWNPSPVDAFTYQWRRDGKAISGATNATYKLTSTSVGKKITVTVTGHLEGYAPTSATSAATAKVGKAFTTVPTPTFSGSVKVGSTLTVKTGTWKPTPSKFYYRWLRNGEDIAGSAGNKSKYKLTSADAGQQISVRIAGKKSGYATEVRTSAAKNVPYMISAKTPSISGKVKVGHTLTAVTGTWSPSDVALTYQWKRSGKSISGATNATYKLKSADAAKKITVTVTGKKAGHTTASKTSSSKKVPKVMTAKTPTFTGTLKVGKTLTVKTGTWKPTPSKFYYRWLRNGEDIAGSAGNKSKYKLTSADAGQQISVRIAGKKSGYATEVRTSAAKNVPLVISAKTPSISGKVKVGYTLTAVTGTWSPADVALTYQWKRSGKSISGATNATYKLKSADAAKKITVTVKGKKPGYYTESRTSSSKTVPKVMTAKTPTFTGTLKVGKTLTVKTGTWKPTPSKFYYRWLRNGEDIPGSAGNKSKYKLTAADADQQISVRIAGKKSGYATEVRTSAAKLVP